MNGHEIFVGVDAATQRLQNLTMSALIRELRKFGVKFLTPPPDEAKEPLTDYDRAFHDGALIMFNEMCKIIDKYDPEASDE